MFFYIYSKAIEIITCILLLSNEWLILFSLDYKMMISNIHWDSKAQNE